MDFLHLLEHHLLDSALWPGVTKHMLLLWISAALLLVTLSLFARNWPLVPTGFRNLIEMFVVFVRDEIVVPNTGEEGKAYLPYFLSLFFFILFCNLLGMVPFGATATGNIAVTATLALITFAMINIAGIREHGFVHYVKSLIPHGLPAWLLPLMFMIEVLGLFTKSFALCIRLFANMIAGHIVILAFVSLIFLFGSVLVAPVSIAAAVGMSFLEIFVAFLQAYIFTLLSAIFVGSAVHPQH